VSYYKFLLPSGLGVFSGYDWRGSAGFWVDADGPVGCRAGIHACRVEDLPYWLADDLWRIELDGPVTAYENKVVAGRGRLGEKVEEWTGQAALEFSAACVGRVAYHAAAELRDVGLASMAEDIDAAVRRFAEGGEWDALTECAAECVQVPVRHPGSAANLLSAYIGDALESFRDDPPAAAAYIAARAASQRSGSVGDDPYLDERRWQAFWLAGRLGLPAPSVAP